MPELEQLLDQLVGAIIIVVLVSLTMLSAISIVWTWADDEDQLG